MTPDLRTVSAMLAASALLMSVVLCVGIRTRRSDGFLKWNLGLGVLAMGWLLCTLRGWLPDAVTVAAAEALLLTGFCLQLAAVTEFGHQRAPRALWLLPGPLLFCALMLVLRNQAALTVATSIACAATLLGTTTAARRLAGGGAPRRMLAIACAAGAVILLARAAAAALLPQAYADLPVVRALEPVALIGLFATSAAASIGFLLLHRERVETGLQRLAAYDPLTAVLNRLAFLNLAEGQVARARRSGEPCALLILNPDHLDRVNESLGRKTGNQVLREFAAVLRGALRVSDLIGRYGDEVVCILLPNTTLAVALEVAERLRAMVGVRRLGGVAPAVTVSVGVAPCEAGRAGALHMAITRAEKALASAQRNGRNRVAGPAAPARAQGSAHPAHGRARLA
jgi:diguanylate cyclase (GGDEF)-like protein